jgi:integrase
LKVGDIDSQRMLLRIEKGKGQKDRYALLPPIMLERLRTWWRYARAEGKVLPGGYLFPGLDPMDSLSTRQLNRAVHEAAKAAHIDKRVTMHTLRHSFATHYYLPRRTMSRPEAAPLGKGETGMRAGHSLYGQRLLRKASSLSPGR